MLPPTILLAPKMSLNIKVTVLVRFFPAQSDALGNRLVLPRDNTYMTHMFNEPFLRHLHLRPKALL